MNRNFVQRPNHALQRTGGPSCLQSSRLVDALDAIVHFKFGNDKAKLSGWKQAKRLEKARAHREARPTNPPPAPAAPTG